MLILALAYLLIYAWPIINPTLDANTLTTIEIAGNLVWALFVVDVLVRLCLNRSPRNFLKSNWLDIVAVAVPVLRPLRGLRILSVAVIASRRLKGALQYKIAIYALGTTLLIVFIAGLAVTEAERNAPGANIHDAFQGWWWAFITLATVGYGDKFPVTPEGQLIAVGVVIAGIGLLGTVSATIASIFIRMSNQHAKEILEEEEDQTQRIAELTKEVRVLRLEVSKLVEREKG